MSQQSHETRHIQIAEFARRAIYSATNQLGMTYDEALAAFRVALLLMETIQELPGIDDERAEALAVEIVERTLEHDAGAVHMLETAPVFTALCLDCRSMVRGDMGVRFVETPLGACVEIILEDLGKAHPICRVPRMLIPTVAA